MKTEPYWNVDDVRPGMKGKGKSVIKGVKIESFDAEVIGVLKNTSPGRDLILVRLAGMGLERSGVIQGMSGSPIYIEGKLLRRVAYAWAFGKDPIAGVTPFSQMVSFAAAYERRDLADEKNKPARIGLAKPIFLDGREYKDVTLADDFREPQPTTADGIWMIPLKTPVMTTGMSPRSLPFYATTSKGPASCRCKAAASQATSPPMNAISPSPPAAHSDRHDYRRLRYVWHRHRHPHRRQTRLRLRPSLHGPRQCDSP